MNSDIAANINNLTEYVLKYGSKMSLSVNRLMLVLKAAISQINVP